MKSACIKLSYHQIIDARTMQNWFEIGIINTSYNEFLLKSQSYNQERRYTTFQQMLANDKRANSLHYKVGFPISPYIDLLQKKIPTLTDNMGNPLRFDTYQFNIIDSDVGNKESHRVGITYFTDKHILIDNIGDYLLLATNNTMEKNAEEMTETFLLKIIPNLSICSFVRLP
jgi:hypothetical protein